VITFVSRCNYGIWLLALALALVGPGWAQTPQTAEPDANLYTRAVALLDQAQQQLTAGNLAPALSLVKQSNELFTRLQKKSAAALAEHQLSRKDEQQLAINEKLAADAQAQADRLMETADAHDKKGQELETQGREEASKASYRQSKDGYNRAQGLYIRSAIYALRNQQMLFRFLSP